ncbi:MAG: adenylyl-sulfate kinase, partial [Chloroflexi bacterium]|nr:adenylyl-sulfate kinase [Chloroflexota bacterium]
PLNPDIQLNTHEETVEESVAKVLAYLEEHAYIPVSEAEQA